MVVVMMMLIERIWLLILMLMLMLMHWKMMMIMLAMNSVVWILIVVVIVVVIVNVYTVFFCLQVVEGSLSCSKCRTALYCNRDCQEKHWPAHQGNCIDSNNAENSREKLEIKAINHSNQGNCIHKYTSKRYHY